MTLFASAQMHFPEGGAPAFQQTGHLILPDPWQGRGQRGITVAEKELLGLGNLPGHTLLVVMIVPLLTWHSSLSVVHCPAAEKAGA